jgi:hypothetical protein
MHFPSPWLVLRLSSLLIAILFMAGCNSPRAAERGPPPPPQIPLAAETTFLDGAILVNAEFGPFDFKGPKEGENETESSRPSRGKRPERGSGGGGGPPPSGDRDSAGGTSARRSGGGGGGGGGGGAMRGPLRQSLSITLKNTSDHPMELRVAEVKSLIGNIVPEPETFTLEPGASQMRPPPMRAGIRESVSEFHLTLRLRTVEANEKKI